MRPTDKIDNLIKDTLKTTASPELDQRIDSLISPSKSAGAEIPSLNTITCFSRAAVARRDDSAWLKAGYKLVPPADESRSMLVITAGRSAADCKGLTQ